MHIYIGKKTNNIQTNNCLVYLFILKWNHIEQKHKTVTKRKKKEKGKKRKKKQMYISHMKKILVNRYQQQYMVSLSFTRCKVHNLAA